MPRSLHAELAKTAEREGISLNQLITSTLASSIGWRDEDGRTPARPSVAATAEPRQARLLVLVLLANAVVIGLAAVAAIALLVLAVAG
jgi:hypothetical protein